MIFLHFRLILALTRTVLSIDSYFFGTGLGEIAEYVDWSWGHYGPGSYDLTQLSLLWDFTSQADSFILATLNITGLNSGMSLLGFNSVTLGNGWGEAIVADIGNSEITVAAPVPEPSTILLFGVGVACLAGFRRRSNSKKNALI